MTERKTKKISVGFTVLVLLSAGLLLSTYVSDSKRHAAEGLQKPGTKTEKRPSNWHNYRGNARLTGEVPDRLPDTVQLSWSFQTGDRIKSSPIVHEDVVFIGSDDGFLYAIRLDDGKKVWVFQADGPIEAPPLYEQESVFVSSVKGTLYSLDARTGGLNWIYSTGDRIVGSANSMHDGEKHYLVAGSHDNHLYCFDMKTGTLIWTYRTESYINGTPSVAGDTVIFGGCDGLCHIISARTGQPIAAIEAGSYVAGSIAVRDSLAVFGNYNGELVGINIPGEKILWSFSEDGTGAFLSSPAISNNTVIAGSQDNRIYCIAADTGKKVWEFATRGNVDSSPIVGDNKIVAASTDGWIYCLDLTGGEEVWSYEIGAAISGSPAFAGGNIIIGAADGNVYMLSPSQ